MNRRGFLAGLLTPLAKPTNTPAMKVTVQCQSIEWPSSGFSTDIELCPGQTWRCPDGWRIVQTESRSHFVRDKV